jgi:hypothetical protein
MRKVILLFILTALYSCADWQEKRHISKIQMDLFDRTFNYSDIKSIDIVEISHPMLGGIISEQTLSEDQKEIFIHRLERLESKGINKCYSKYVIRIIISNDTLRLKTCGEMVSNRNKDLFYAMPYNDVLIDDFIKH